MEQALVAALFTMFLIVETLGRKFSTKIPRLWSTDLVDASEQRTQFIINTWATGMPRKRVEKE
jgi:hypothetical protein